MAIVSGMVCDGAKASCAAKMASSVDAGILGISMYKTDSNSMEVRTSHIKAWKQH